MQLCTAPAHITTTKTSYKKPKWKKKCGCFSPQCAYQVTKINKIRQREKIVFYKTPPPNGYAWWQHPLGNFLQSGSSKCILVLLTSATFLWFTANAAIRGWEWASLEEERNLKGKIIRPLFRIRLGRQRCRKCTNPFIWTLSHVLKYS